MHENPLEAQQGLGTLQEASAVFEPVEPPLMRLVMPGRSSASASVLRLRLAQSQPGTSAHRSGDGGQGHAEQEAEDGVNHA